MSLFGGVVPRVVRELAENREMKQLVRQAEKRPDSDRLGMLRAEHDALREDVEDVKNKLAGVKSAVGNLESRADDQEAWNADCESEVGTLKAGRPAVLCRDPASRHPGRDCGIYCMVTIPGSSERSREPEEDSEDD